MMAVQPANVYIDSLMHQAAPDHKPPDIEYKDADEIYLPAGQYYKMGGDRHNGQYREPLPGYFTVASKLAVDIDGTYAAGVTSGMIGGAKVNSSWYSLFFMTNSIVLALPYLRIKAIAYSSDTIINPGDHATGGSYEDGFILANDAWNGYRLVKKSIGNAYDGTVYTISDSVTGTHDEVHIAGDKTSELAALDWLQVIPPVDVECLYLGTVGFDSSGNLLSFLKTGWRTDFGTGVKVQGNKSASSIANTDVSAGLPPCALIAHARLNSGNQATGRNGHVCYLYDGISGGSIPAGGVAFGDELGAWPSTYNIADFMEFHPDNAAATYQFCGETKRWRMRATNLIRNVFMGNNGGTWAAAAYGWFGIIGWEE